MPKRPRKSYQGRVYESRKRISEDERRARGEKTDNAQFADDLVKRIRKAPP